MTGRPVILQVAVSALLVAGALSACGPGVTLDQAAARAGVAPAALVRVDDRAAAARRNGDTLEVVLFEPAATGGYVSRVITRYTPAAVGRNSVTFAGGGPIDAAGRWTGMVYGTAVPPASTVRIDGFAEERGGTIVDGVWLVLLPVPDLNPSDVRYVFLTPDGSPVISGSGGL